nr:hypothetical protein Itr_chr07CG15590 [Ipomoea trifida]
MATKKSTLAIMAVVLFVMFFACCCYAGRPVSEELPLPEETTGWNRNTNDPKVLNSGEPDPDEVHEKCPCWPACCWPENKQN